MYVVFRAQSDTIVLREWINPDEGDLLAAGRRAALGFVPFENFTSSTYGPLWPLTLGVIARLGLPLTLPMAHVLNAAIICGVCIALARVVWRRWNPVLSVLTVGPIVIHWSKGFYSQDFYSLSTEMVPLVFLVAGSIAAFRPGPLSQRRALAAAVLLGSAVWAKYSFTPLAGVALVALLVRMRASGHPSRNAVLTCLVAPAAPFAILAGWALLDGVPPWKITETVDIAVNYLGGGGLTRTTPSLDERIDQTRTAVSMFRSMVPLAALLVSTLVVGLLHHRPRRGTVRHDHHTQLRALAVLAALAGVGSLMVLVPIFPHYTLLFVTGIVLATFILASLDPVPVESHRHAPAAAALTALALGAWALPPVIERAEIPLYRWTRGAEAATTWDRVFTERGGLWERSTAPNSATTPANSRLLSHLCPRDSRVIVWGWAPDLYSQYDWTPATRYVITTPAMTGAADADSVPKFRTRLLADFRAEKPRCVVDGASPALYPSWGPENSLAVQWPEFVTELSATHARVEITLHGTAPLVVWVRTP